MKCREMNEFLMAYLDEELPEGPRASFEEHLAMCPPCVDYLDTYRDAVRMGRSVCREDDP